MKNIRQNAILEIIRKNEVETQEMLQMLLKDMGFKVTQATVSRDIKELQLVKAISENGKLRYIHSDAVKSKRSILKDTVLSVDNAMNIAVLKCNTGMAQAACAELDSMHFDNVAGTLAGDDTIFVLFKSQLESENFVKIILEIIG